MIVDAAELRSQTFGDPDLLREVVGLFVLETTPLLSAMEAAGGVGRAEIAHRLKGSSLALGAHALADIATRLEQQPDDAAALAEVRRLAHATMESLRAIAGLPA